MGEKDIFAVKKGIQDTIKNKYMLPQSNRFTGLIVLSNADVLTPLLEGCKYLGVNFVVVTTESIASESDNITIVKKVEPNHIPGFDFIVCDSDCDKLGEYLKHGIVPITNKDNYLSALLSEFNPMKNEGNSFLYDKYNEWSVFHALTRYMENAKFPFDNRNLVKNVLKV